MGGRTGIEWTERTWNPIVGCSVLSPGCTNCYAMRQAARIVRMQPDSHYGGTTAPSRGGDVWTGVVKEAPARILTQPLRWSSPHVIFVNSMSDPFHPAVPDAWVDRILSVVALTPHHTYQMLTKRPDRMRAYFTGDYGMRIGGILMERARGNAGAEAWVVDLVHRTYATRQPLANLWLGTSAEDQSRYDARRNDLFGTPAAVRFISFEPLIGPIEADWVGDWAIVGGESGAGARPMQAAWARLLRDACARTTTPFFFKQWGAWLVGERDGDTMRYPDGSEAPWEGAAPMRRAGPKTSPARLDGIVHHARP